MPLPNLPQKQSSSYTTDPLRGSRKNGTLQDDDFLSTLYVSRMIYQHLLYVEVHDSPDIPRSLVFKLVKTTRTLITCISVAY
jgi:hypothetical protein